MARLDDIVTVVAGLDHPEGVATGPDGMLYAGGEAGQVYRIDPGLGTFEQIASTSGFCLGVCTDAAGSVFVCDSVRAAVLRVNDAGHVDVYCDSAGGGKLVCPNWLAFAQDGSLWLTDSGTPRACDGRLIRVPPQGGQGERVDVPPLHYPNGLAFDRAGHLLVVETFTPRLSRLDDSGLSTVADLKWVVPDGVAIDADGDAIIGCYYPFRLLRVNSKGVSMLVDDPFGFTLQMPANVAFFGERLDQLAIAALGGWSITTLQMPTPGAPLVYP